MSEAFESAQTVVFQGTVASCLEYGLVLDAKGIAYRLIEEEGAACSLWVASKLAPAAAEELARYAAERGTKPVLSDPFVPFAGGVAGAFVYVAVLLAVAYCAGNQSFDADWLSRGALDSAVGRAGEWWRCWTALTLHLDQEHLLGNVLFGAGIGILAARMFGPGVAWLSILSCGAVANYADMLLSPASHRALGASTAVFAGLGLLAGFGWRQRFTLRTRERRLYQWGPLFGGVCLLALLGAGSEHVDVLGHFLGFVVGTVCGVMFAHFGLPRSRDSSLQWAAALLCGGEILAAWVLALR